MYFPAVSEAKLLLPQATSHAKFP